MWGSDSHVFYCLVMLVISRNQDDIIVKKNIAVLGPRVHDCISVTTSRDRSWQTTSRKLESITTRFWVPKSSVRYRKLQIHYFLTKHFWPRRHLIASFFQNYLDFFFKKQITTIVKQNVRNNYSESSVKLKLLGLPDVVKADRTLARLP